MKASAFSDAVQSGEPIRVLARVYVLATSEGGKTQPFSKNYRPNHNFGEPEATEFYVGQIEVPDNTLVHPGETRDLTVTFLPGPGLSNLLQVGRSWRIQEGRKLVAKAQVLERQGEA